MNYCFSNKNSLTCDMLCPIDILIETGMLIQVGVFDGIADSSMLYWNSVIMN